MSDRQDAHELQIFRLFVESAGLGLAPNSVQKRQPPEPDIHCELSEYGRTYFELVEVVDSDLARAVGNQLTFQQRLADAAENYGLRGFSDGLVYLRFADVARSAQRNGAIPLLLELLQGLPEGFQGDVTLTDNLRAAVRLVRISRGDFVGPCFQVDGTTFISDPIVERIDGKFGKRYETGDRLELLAFYELHPTARAEMQLPVVEALVRDKLHSTQFSRVWIFDAGRRVVLYAFD